MIDEIHLPSELASTVRARRWIVQSVSDVADVPVDAIALVVTELVSNVIRHARTGCVVRIDRRPGAARIEVVDFAAGQVVMRDPEPSELTGRGLQIVTSLVDEWGVTTDQGRTGKTVWASFTWPAAGVASPVTRATTKAQTKVVDPASSSGPSLLARPQAA